MKIKLSNSRPWGNRQSFIHYYSGLLSIGFYGYVMSIIVKRNEYRNHVLRMKSLGFSGYFSSFPFEEKDLGL